MTSWMTFPRWLVVVFAACAVALTVVLAVRWRYLGPVSLGGGAGGTALIYDTWRGRFCVPQRCIPPAP